MVCSVSLWGHFKKERLKFFSIRISICDHFTMFCKTVENSLANLCKRKLFRSTTTDEIFCNWFQLFTTPPNRSFCSFSSISRRPPESAAQQGSSYVNVKSISFFSFAATSRVCVTTCYRSHFFASRFPVSDSDRHTDFCYYFDYFERVNIKLFSIKAYDFLCVDANIS